MSKKIKRCPKCGEKTEICAFSNNPDILMCCACNFKGNRGAFEAFIPTIFDRITASPEVLAEKLVYAHECCRIPDGATSPFIDEIFWFDDEKGDTWDDRFDSAWKKAIAATLKKLKEVEK